MGLSNLNLHAQGPDLLIPVLVQPGARRDEILGVREGFLKVSVSAPPVEGKANAACRRLLAEALRVPMSRVEIMSGAKARRKRIRIRNADLATIKAHLAPFLK
ncbi:MAG: DUF167 domain-containing protein [candidate division NC10 bacterium]|jgi:hypothetical protein|nr:YggU family protein [candidate division NC10 bacterium]MCH7896634.1 YggU family protein [candidate division NC10 bacterium]MCZ6551067.1 DUF167 domain-containing protein [candidate division NC10 bacterium]